MTDDPFNLEDGEAPVTPTVSAAELNADFANRLNAFNQPDPEPTDVHVPLGIWAVTDGDQQLPTDNDVSPVSMPSDPGNRGKLLDNDEAMIDMLTEQMDSELQAEVQRADEISNIRKVQDMVDVDLISRDVAVQCESYCPGIVASCGGLGAFTVNPSRNGLAELRRAVHLRASTFVIGTMAMEDGSNEGAMPVLFSELETMVDKVNEATRVLNEECQSFPAGELTGYDRVMLGYQGFWLKDVDLETMDVRQFALQTRTPAEEAAKAVETIVLEYLSPKRQDIRASIGLTGPVTIRALYDVVVNRSHLSYIADLHAQLEVLYTRIHPAVEQYMGTELLKRDPAVLVPVVNDVREYCRIAKIYRRLCTHNVVFESAVRALLDWHRQVVAMA